MLQAALGRNTTSTVFYVLGNLDKPTITGVKSYVESLTIKEITYKIYATPDINVNGTASLFDDIVEFE